MGAPIVKVSSIMGDTAMTLAAQSRAQANPRGLAAVDVTGGNVWAEIQLSAMTWAAQEPALLGTLRYSVLGPGNLQDAIAIRLAYVFAGDGLQRGTLRDLFAGVLADHEEITSAACADLVAIRTNDPATSDFLTPFLFLKGFAAATLHRIAHSLWLDGRHPIALALQQRMSVVTGIDIHPGAVIGQGILLDHATGIVIGETAVVGDWVTMFHNVTLGGTGKQKGDRHPKVGKGAFIGAGAKILGNIKIGDWSRVGAGSVVLQDVPPLSVAVGVPAQVTPADLADWSIGCSVGLGI